MDPHEVKGMLGHELSEPLPKAGIAELRGSIGDLRQERVKNSTPLCPGFPDDLYSTTDGGVCKLPVTRL
jgi:hypothetical protein